MFLLQTLLKRNVRPSLKSIRAYKADSLGLKKRFPADIAETTEALKEPFPTDVHEPGEALKEPFPTDVHDVHETGEALKEPFSTDVHETGEALKEPFSTDVQALKEPFSTDVHETREALKALKKPFPAVLSTTRKDLLFKSPAALPSYASVTDHFSDSTISNTTKGTSLACLRNGNTAFLGADGLGSNVAGEIEEDDVQKIFAFEEHNHMFGKVIMMYGGYSYYPELMSKALCAMPGEVNAENCSKYAKGLLERAKKAALSRKDKRASESKKLLPNDNDRFPEDEMDLFKCIMIFVSVGQYDTSIYRLNGFDCTIDNKFLYGIIDGTGKDHGRSYYETYYERYYDIGDLYGPAFENYLEAFNEYMILDIMLACSKDPKSGGRIQVMKISPVGVEKIWDNSVNLLFEERARHFQSEVHRLRSGIIDKISLIEWDFATAEKSRFDRGVIDFVRSRSYERYANFQSSNF